MRATASLHSDDARRHGFGERWDAPRPDASPLHDRSRAIQPNEAAAVFSQIDAENRDFHCHAPFFPVALFNLHCKRRGAAHPINFAELVAAVIPPAAQGKSIELWWQDEARVGQKGSLTRIWTQRGSRPTAPRAQRSEWAY